MNETLTQIIDELKSKLPPEPHNKNQKTVSEPESAEVVASHELLAKIEEQEKLLELYREMVGRMALAKDKNDSWRLMKCWWNGQRTIGHDLKTPEEQQAFLFG